MQAVDRAELHYLVNCLVFPQQGVRSHANETSGGDLDGKHGATPQPETTTPQTAITADERVELSTKPQAACE